MDKGCRARLRRDLAFWLRIMKEHALFIQLGLRFFHVPLISEADFYYQSYRALEERLAREGPSPALITAARRLTVAFRQFKLRVLELALVCAPGGSGSNYPLLMDHIAREADYFLALLSGELAGDLPPAQEAARELVFWLRIMADHLRFIFHLTDPSQVDVLGQAQGLIAQVDPLLRQARDYESMLRADPPRFPALVRLVDETIRVTEAVRDFKTAATVLLAECKVLAIAPALLGDHVRREAEHFLAILAALRPRLAFLAKVEPQTLDADHLHDMIWACPEAPHIPQ
ncbi:MAG: DUF2935 domain-containing protein [Bacillota bacterium]|nr:DUF2935 domain-containing protein [Bacillota bacterium]